MATFQWPTGQNFWNYLTDCPRAERYVPDIERTLALLAKSRASHINIIAYSCGSPLLGQALARLRAVGVQDHERLRRVGFFREEPLFGRDPTLGLKLALD